MTAPKADSQRWTPHQARALEAAVEELGRENWDAVAMRVGRSASSCRFKAYNVCPVTAEERKYTPPVAQLHPTLTGRICGDPAPGRSALDMHTGRKPA